MKTTYDIFISYRRTAYDTANLIAEKLRSAGYKVFFDIDTLTSGKFNEQLLEVIKECKDFVVVLPENALERCKDEDDWIRREVTCAIEHGKNIIPVMLDGFSWPKELPKGMEELPNYQAITAIKGEYFDMSITRLKGYLKSKPATPMKNWIRRTAFILGVVLVLVFIGLLVMNHIANVTCEEIAAKQTNVMDVVDMLCDSSKQMERYTEDYFSEISQCKDDKEREEIKDELRTLLGKIEGEVDNLQKTVPAPDFSMKGIDSYVLARYDIKQAELDGFSQYYSSFYDDFHAAINLLREIIDMDDFSEFRKGQALLEFSTIEYSVNAFYYAYLGSMSLLPKSARKVYYEHAMKWKNFPNGTPLDLPQEEYEKFQMNEMNKLNADIDRYGGMVKYRDVELDEMGRQLEELEEKINNQ